MKKIVFLLATAVMVVGTIDCQMVSAKTATMLRIPDTGYTWGYKAGRNWLAGANNPDDCTLRHEWHRALDNAAGYASIGDTGHADWWQGYADALNYVDNGWYECP